MARGLNLGQAVNAFAGGASAGLGIVDQYNRMGQVAEERQMRMEDRAESKADRARVRSAQDEAAERERGELFVGEQMYRAKNGLEVDREGLKRYGINPEKHLSDQLGEWTSVVGDVMQGKREAQDPDVLRLFNWRFSDQINKGVGEAIQSEQVADDGTKIPKGSKIASKQVVGLKPAPGGKGLVAALRVTATTPDGKTQTYVAPMTEGRDSSPTAGMLVVPADKLIQTYQADSLLADAWRSPALMKELEARYVGLGGKPASSEGLKFQTVQDGDEQVTYAVGADGKMQEVGRGTAPAIRSAQIRAAAQKASGGGGSRAAGGADQQMIEYLGQSLFGNEKDGAKRTTLAIEKLKDIKRAASSAKDPREAVNKVAQTLLARKTKDRRGEESYQYTPQQAFAEAEKLVGAMGASEDFSSQWGEGGGQPPPESEGAEDFSALWSE